MNELTLRSSNPNTITFSTQGTEPVLILHPDGRVEWLGEQTEAAIAFWKIVEQAFPWRGEIDALTTRLQAMTQERDEAKARATVEDMPGRPVAAPCAVEGCSYFKLEALTQLLARLKGKVAEWRTAAQKHNALAESDNTFEHDVQCDMANNHADELDRLLSGSGMT